LPFEQYGGRNAPVSAYAILVREKGRIELRSVPIMRRDEFEKSPDTFFEKNVEILSNKPIPKYQRFNLGDGRKRMLASYQEAQKAGSFALDFEKYRLINDILEAKDESFVEDHWDEISRIIDDFSRYVDSGKLLQGKPASKLRDLLDEFNENRELEALRNLLNVFVNVVSFGTTYNKVTGQMQYKVDNMDLENAILVYYSITGLLETRVSLKGI
jgi:CRISPR-associated endonuclease Csn1